MCSTDPKGPMKQFQRSRKVEGYFKTFTLYNFNTFGKKKTVFLYISFARVQYSVCDERQAQRTKFYEFFWNKNDPNVVELKILVANIGTLKSDTF